MRKTLIELNLFKDNENNQHQIKYQRIASRCYLFILFISIIISSIYLLLNKELQQKTIAQPSELQFQNLETIYSSNLYCPCSIISMNYSSFLTIKRSFHQVCSSDIVSDIWINYIKGDNMLNDYYPIFDLRNGGVSLFQLLAMLCEHAQQTVDISIKTFLQTQFLSSQVISQNRFEIKINSSVNDLISQTIEKFLQTIQIFQEISHGNQLMSQQFLYSVQPINAEATKMNVEIRNYFNCSCTLSSSCHIPIGAYATDQQSWEIYHTYFIVPNFFLGCSLIDGLMKSTLECFYNLSCMMEYDLALNNYDDIPFSFTNLNENLNLPNETIQSIINVLMIDSWTSTSSFSSYYNTCLPASCTYEYLGRNDLFVVITTILGIVGGLSLGLKLLILIILRFTQNLMNNISFRGLINIIKKLFICNTEQRIINRLHFGFLLLVLYIIFIFSAFQPISVTVQKIKPSFSTYQNLFKDYPSSLQCSCSQISISYGTFLNN